MTDTNAIRDPNFGGDASAEREQEATEARFDKQASVFGAVCS